MPTQFTDDLDRSTRVARLHAVDLPAPVLAFLQTLACDAGTTAAAVAGFALELWARELDMMEADQQPVRPMLVRLLVHRRNQNDREGSRA